MKRARVRLAVAVVALLAAFASAWARADDPFARWRPGVDMAGVRYVGSAACAACHEREAASYAATPMARAAAAPAASEVLAKRSKLTFREGPYTYEVARRGDGAVYTVRDATSSISEPIFACVGRGQEGQTFLFRHDGVVYESRVSYFAKPDGLDITILHPRAVPASLGEALGRRMSPESARGCVGCHATAVAGSERLEVDRHTAGVGCESCHGPGERHVAAAKSAKEGGGQILDPRKLDGIEVSQELCGACHMSFDAVMLGTTPGPETIRFQPYRMFKSAAHVLDDRRVSCVACHDPHAPTVRDASFYDAKCQACHATTKPCPKASSGCVSCHMPKAELADMHATFTDHYIQR